MPIIQKSPAKRKRKRGEVANSQSGDSEEDLVDPFDHEEDAAEDEVILLRASEVRAEDDDPALAQFEAAMEAGFDEI